jgi:DNA-binding response OmpR family regulator
VFERKTILIAEDEESDLDFFELMLSKLGFKIEKASGGNKALELIKRNSVDMALIKTILPEISGWEILKTIQNDPKLSSIPVILISDIDNVKEKVESFELGAEDYITKPFNFSVVLSRIRAALRKRELLVQIKLREKRLELAEETGNDVKEDLNVEYEAVVDTHKEATGLIHDGFDEKTFITFLTKIQGKAIESINRIRSTQAKLDYAFEAGEAVKTKEIRLDRLERPE